MKSRRNRTTGGADSGRRKRGRNVDDDIRAWPDDAESRGDRSGPAESSLRGADRDRSEPRASESPAEPGRVEDAGEQEPEQPDYLAPAGKPVAWRTASGWRVGDEEVSDLTSAMVLADLLAADLPPGGAPPAPPPGAAASRPATRDTGPADGDELDARKLQETVAQLEHALTVRVRVEQAIGVLAERHRLRPRQAFELLRSAARIRGRRVLEVAGEVVDSATNPLLRIPEELAKPPVARRRGRLPRHSLSND